MNLAESGLQALIRRIPPPDEEARAAVRARQDRLTKPPGSLGALEDLSARVAAAQGTSRPTASRKTILVMAGDHGVVEEGVSAWPPEVTAQMVGNFLAGGAAINVLARQVGARVVVADLGVASPLPDHPALRRRRVADGTANLARGPAMTREQALDALSHGRSLLEEEHARGLDVVGLGDMGIGNTTSSAALAAALTGLPPAILAGPGAGLDAAGVQRKVEVLERALRLHRSSDDGLEILARFGGFEIAGLAGAALAAASLRVPVVVDGFIATAAAMVAVRLAPGAKPYLVAAHRSREPGHTAMLEWLGLEPLLDLQMRLGEGSGAALAMALVEAACRTLDEMATFGEAGVTERP